MKHHMFHKCNNLSEYDYNIKEKIKRKIKSTKKVISKSQMIEIYKKACEFVSNELTQFGKLEDIKHTAYFNYRLNAKIKQLRDAF